MEYMSDFIKEAFFQVCDKAVPAKQYCVSLYTNVPFHGGPEEGGWWGNDCNLVAYHAYSTEAAAEAAVAQLEQQVADWNKEAKKDFGRQCQAEMDWLNERGLESSFLPEPDGEVEYFVCVEDQPGSQAYKGNRYYE